MTETINWEIQNSNSPLFSDILWDKPENKFQSNSLLIIGGSSSSFNLVSDAFGFTQKLLFSRLTFYLPKTLEKITGSFLSDGSYGQINNSGSFSMINLENLINLSAQHDSTIIVGNLGESSETNLLFEKLNNQIEAKNLILCNDSLKLLNGNQLKINPEKFTLIVDIPQVQKLLKTLNYHQTVKSSDDLSKIANVISQFSEEFSLKIILRLENYIFVFADNRCSLTKKMNLDDKWQTKIAVETAVWLNYDSTKKYERLTTAAYSI